MPRPDDNVQLGHRFITPAVRRRPFFHHLKRVAAWGSLGVLLTVGAALLFSPLFGIPLLGTIGFLLASTALFTIAIGGLIGLIIHTLRPRDRGLPPGGASVEPRSSGNDILPALAATAGVVGGLGLLAAASSRGHHEVHGHRFWQSSSGLPVGGHAPYPVGGQVHGHLSTR